MPWPAHDGWTRPLPVAEPGPGRPRGCALAVTLAAEPAPEPPSFAAEEAHRIATLLLELAAALDLHEAEPTVAHRAVVTELRSQALDRLAAFEPVVAHSGLDAAVREIAARLAWPQAAGLRRQAGIVREMFGR